MTLIQEFSNPSSAYRGKPFWSWNGALSPDELRRQLRIFKQMGMGGAFLHSRVGLATEFLGPEWFECIKACVDECRQQDLEAWLYDEDRWPSGAAGGLVTKDPRFRMRYLMMEIVQPKAFRWNKGLLGAWEGKVDRDAVSDLRRLKKGQRPSSSQGNRVIVIYPKIHLNMSWYNGYTYLDTMSREAVDRFIKVAYDPYKRHVGKEFGKLIPGIFTDEPNYHLSLIPQPVKNPYALLPWTPKLPDVFKKRYGYNLIDYLPELFFEIEDKPLSSARYHFFDCVTHLFTDNFARRIGKWCKKNNLLFTGHVLLEETLHTQTWAVGSTMRFYEHMQAPGIDVLTQYSDVYDTAKQCSSVANQMGNQWILSELYGCTGWDFPFEGHKAVGDWQTAMGINIRCHHLSWYTMKGEAKRDYPASIFYQSPWWEHYRVVEDYFSRLHVLLTQGKPDRRLLVIHPIESAWLCYRPPIAGVHSQTEPDTNWKAAIQIDKRMKKLRNWLLEEHIDFDYGDEEMLGRVGSVRRGKSKPALRLGKADYDAVLVPPQLTIRGKTLEILERFEKAGGHVVFTGKLPAAIDGRAANDIKSHLNEFDHIPFNRKSVAQAARESAGQVSIQNMEGQEAKPVLHYLRRDKDRAILFVCNTDRKNALPNLIVKVKAKGRVVEWNPSTGERWRLPFTAKKGWVEFATDLPAAGSRVFTIESSSAKSMGSIRKKSEWIERTKQSLGNPVGFQLSEPNVLVLDRPEYRYDNQPWKPPLEILKIDDQIRSHLGIEQRGCQMVQPWAQEQKKKEPHCPVSLRYTFQVKDLPRTPIHLVLETPDRYRICLNGISVSSDSDQGWWVDPCLRKIPIDPSNIRHGKNEILLKIDFHSSDDLETVFLLGDFGVSMTGETGTLTSLPRNLRLGNWVSQKLPFYGGAVTYRFLTKPAKQKGERVVLSAPGFQGTVIRVLVDGQHAGYLPWPPYELDLTDYIGSEPAEIALEVFGSRRNCFGPLHLKNPKPRWTGPLEYRTTGSQWQEDYHLKRCGLFKTPVLIYQQKA